MWLIRFCRVGNRLSWSYFNCLFVLAAILAEFGTNCQYTLHSSEKDLSFITNVGWSDFANGVCRV